MDHTEEAPRPAKPHLQEYEDPHYHDDDPEPNTEDRERRAAGPVQRKPAWRIPPPPRRRAED